MTSVLSSLVATIALAADPGSKGLPLGLPPAADDAVIAHVAPPHCLLYVNWAGTAAPDASSGSETEKLLAEPEVQQLLGSVNRMIVAALKNADKQNNVSTSSPGAMRLATFQILPPAYQVDHPIPVRRRPRTSLRFLRSRFPLPRRQNRRSAFRPRITAIGSTFS